jgi:hypothetical protein
VTRGVEHVERLSYNPPRRAYGGNNKSFHMFHQQGFSEATARFQPPTGPERCPECGWHWPTQAHRVGCTRAPSCPECEAFPAWLGGIDSCRWCRAREARKRAVDQRLAELGGDA